MAERPSEAPRPLSSTINPLSLKVSCILSARNTDNAEPVPAIQKTVISSGIIENPTISPPLVIPEGSVPTMAWPGVLASPVTRVKWSRCALNPCSQSKTARATRATCSRAFRSDLSLAIARIP